MKDHSDNAFYTLTYDDKHLPLMSGGFATLVPRDLQNFLKRLRKRVSPIKLRFYACGEYGEENWRPHYHLAVFGLPSCRRGTTGLGRIGNAAHWSKCCSQCVLVGEEWGNGNVYLGVLEEHSAQYVAGYVTKKMTHRRDYRLLGREPEFSRMSNRPGIGLTGAIDEFASQYMRFNLDQSQSDVPVTLRHGSRQLPLGRYLRNKIRARIGKEEATPIEVLKALAEEMRAVSDHQFKSEKKSLKQAYLELNKGKAARFHARQRMQRKDRKL